MGEKSYRLSVRMVNTNTGEVLASSAKPVTMFCNGDGEAKIHAWINSLIRGLRNQNDGLSLEFDFKPIVPLSQPLIF